MGRPRSNVNRTYPQFCNKMLDEDTSGTLSIKIPEAGAEFTSPVKELTLNSFRLNWLMERC